MYTTNEEDQRKAAALKARLAEQSATCDGNAGSDPTSSVPAVSMDEGAHKYVLIKASRPKSTEPEYFVVSSRFANYHQDAAEPMVESLERGGYGEIDVTGGGRINLDTSGKKISIYGFSYGFGLADHSISKRVVQADPRYKDFEIDTSNEGY
ncbi:14 kDa phosphohistidine phosphatase [Seminavis robusta]|uniref:14 kDa phosphohistidine phosphatase n=1 Tax=Seminavis robusta TaxID=568900 RepID=A0A9N8DQI4_9STRA|nr:14 kDa phosphohistidine phosphatase [Seminavis robusta]|eukprot:Sro299_g111500.1 14 kDa phosphohistidine phosphatase (152) ;mRNA; r:67110-67565